MADANNARVIERLGELVAVFSKAAGNNAVAVLDDFALRHVIPITPVATGKLRKSKRVTQEKDGSRLEFTDPKAAAVHGRTDQKHESPTQSKFLESAVLQHGDELVLALANATEDGLRGA
jgi:hypothetical protein